MTEGIASRFHSRTMASLAVALILTAAPAPARAAETIKVGFMAPLSGIFAQAGKDMLEGIKLAFEQIGYQTAGRKIELIEEDDGGNPAVAQAKYRKLIPPIERDKLPTLYWKVKGFSWHSRRDGRHR